MAGRAPARRALSALLAAALALATAAPALGCGGDLSDIAFWTRLLRDPDPRTRVRAATALGENRTSGARPALVEALRDPDERVRDAAARALERLEPRR
jgi:HEAT repeat protein